MNFHYDKETDSLYIDFIDGPGVDNVIITDDIVAGLNPVLRPAGQ